MIGVHTVEYKTTTTTSPPRRRQGRAGVQQSWRAAAYLARYSRNLIVDNACPRSSITRVVAHSLLHTRSQSPRRVVEQLFHTLINNRPRSSSSSSSHAVHNHNTHFFEEQNNEVLNLLVLHRIAASEYIYPPDSSSSSGNQQLNNRTAKREARKRDQREDVREDATSVSVVPRATPPKPAAHIPPAAAASSVRKAATRTHSSHTHEQWNGQHQ